MIVFSVLLFKILSDFPEVHKMQEKLRDADFSKFRSLNKKELEKVI